MECIQNLKSQNTGINKLNHIILVITNRDFYNIRSGLNFVQTGRTGRTGTQLHVSSSKHKSECKSMFLLSHVGHAITVYFPLKIKIVIIAKRLCA